MKALSNLSNLLDVDRYHLGILIFPFCGDHLGLANRDITYHAWQLLPEVSPLSSRLPPGARTDADPVIAIIQAQCAHPVLMRVQENIHTRALIVGPTPKPSTPKAVIISST